MKWLITVLACCSIASAEPTVEYDKFRGETTLMTGPLSVRAHGHDGSLTLVVAAVYEGQVSTGSPRKIAIVFHSASDDWQYLKDQNSARLIVIADDDRVEVVVGKYDGNVKLGGVTETLFFLVSTEQFRKIAAAKSIEGQLHFDEFKLTPDQVSEVRGLGERMELVDPPPVVVPFEDTPIYLKLKGDADAAKESFDTVKRGAIEQLQRDPEFKKAMKLVADLELKKRDAQGDARLQVAKEWLDAKGRLEAMRRAFLEQHPETLAAKESLEVAEAALLGAKIDYQAHPTTRPARKARG